jgi:hypothetical protein
MDWLSAKAAFGLARWVWGLIVLVAAVLALGALYGAITAKPKAEARLATNQVQAAQQNGADAVNVVGQAGEREAASDDLTRSNDKEIRNAQGADAPVAAAARNAGLASLCRRASYQRDPKCVQYANSR